LPNNKVWYEKNPGTRKRDRARNYAKTRKGAVNSGRFWSQNEILAIQDRSCTDRELASRLGRSVQAIQVKRTKLAN
jgi:hypothetical protein